MATLPKERSLEIFAMIVLWHTGHKQKAPTGKHGSSLQKSSGGLSTHPKRVTQHLTSIMPAIKGKPIVLAMVGGVEGVTRIDAIVLPYQAECDKLVNAGTHTEEQVLKKVAQNISKSKSKTFRSKTIAACPDKCDDCKSDNCKWVGESITDLESFEKYVKHGAKFASEASVQHNKQGN